MRLVRQNPSHVLLVVGCFYDHIFDPKHVDGANRLLGLQIIEAKNQRFQLQTCGILVVKKKRLQN